MVAKMRFCMFLYLFVMSTCSRDTTSQPKPDGKINVRFKEWKKIIPGTNFQPASNEIDYLAISDNNWFYAAANGGGKIFCANASQIQDLFSDSKWTALSINNTGLSLGHGTIPDLTLTAERIWRLVPTKAGAVVSLFTMSAKPLGGAVALIEGNSFKAAWTPGVNLITSMAMWSVGGVLTRPDGSQYLYAGNQDGPNTFITSSNEITTPAIVDELEHRYTSKTPFKAIQQYFTQAAGKAFIVDKDGARTYANQNDVGTATPLESVIPEASSDRWPKNSIKAVMGAGDYLYVGFERDRGSSDGGGVFVFNAATSSSAPTVHASWNGVSVLAFAVDTRKNVWAVTEKGLYLVHVNGERGASLKDQLEGASSQGFPTDHITDAKFIGKNLAISTSNDGIIVGLE